MRLIRRWYDKWAESSVLGPREKIAAGITAAFVILFVAIFASIFFPFAVAHSRQVAKINAWNNFHKRMIKEAVPGRAFSEISGWARKPDHLQSDPDLIRSESKLAQKNAVGVSKIVIFLHSCGPFVDHLIPTCPDERLLLALDSRDQVIWTHREMAVDSF